MYIFTEYLNRCASIAVMVVCVVKVSINRNWSVSSMLHNHMLPTNLQLYAHWLRYLMLFTLHPGSAIVMDIFSCFSILITMWPFAKNVAFEVRFYVVISSIIPCTGIGLFQPKPTSKLFSQVSWAKVHSPFSNVNTICIQSFTLFKPFLSILCDLFTFKTSVKMELLWHAPVLTHMQMRWAGLLFLLWWGAIFLVSKFAQKSTEWIKIKEK